MLMCTSLRRVRLHLAGSRSAPMSDGVGGDSEDVALSLQDERNIKSWIATVSGQFRRFLDRQLEIAEVTAEYFRVKYAKRIYYPDAYPVTTTGSLEYDSTGRFDGSSESELDIGDDYVLGGNDDSLILQNGFNWVHPKGLKLSRYIGGMADHPVNSIFNMTATTGVTASVDHFVFGSISGARGVIVNHDLVNDRVTIENYYGSFAVGDVLEDEATEGASGTTFGTISSFQEQSLADVYPDVVKACEMQVRYYWDRVLTFENRGTNKEGVTFRRPDRLKEIEIPLQPEVINLLMPYKRIVM